MRTTTRLSRPLSLRVSRGLAALAVGGTLVLAGCSSDSDEPDADASSETSDEASDDASDEASDDASDDASEDASEDATPAPDDATVTYDLPDGWEDVSAEAEQQAGDASGGQLVSAAREPLEGNDFANNVNVIQLGAAPTDDLAQIEQQSLAQLEAGGLEDAETLDRTELDGEESVRQTGVVTTGPTPYRVDQFITLRDDQAWVVTFSHKTDTPERRRTADIDTVTQSLDFED